MTKHIKFIQTHNADDIVSAITKPEYFGLDADTHTAIASWVFNAINCVKAELKAEVGS